MKYLLGLVCLLLAACGKSNLFENIGSAMSPTIKNGEIVEVLPLDDGVDTIRRHDVVLFLDPSTSDKRYFIMRVWGLPGDLIEIKEGKILANKEPVESPQKVSLDGISDYGKITSISLGSREFFVLGDNVGNSWDSRFWGPLPRENIIGIWEGTKQ